MKQYFTLVKRAIEIIIFVAFFDNSNGIERINAPLNVMLKD
jgi:hypothetical protein